MKITTVKLKHNTKSSLDEIRAEGETYDSIISKLLKHFQDKDLKKRLIEGYTAMAKRDRDIVKEWEVASNEV